MTEPGSTMLTDEHGGVVDRRRFIPSPPCLPSDAPPPFGAVRLSDVSEDLQRSLLPSIAASIDRIHRYRVAHGSLSPQTILVDGTTIWISGVDAVWNERGEGGSPRERDLAWFRGECERWLGPSVQPGIGRTCRGMLAAWRESPPISAAPAPNGRPQLPRPLVRKKRLRRRIPWRSVAVVILIVSVVASVGAWQLTSLPVYTTRALRWGFRKLPVTARTWIDPDGKFDPVGRRLRAADAQDYWSRLELGLSMQRRESLIQALSEPGDEYTELLRRFIRANDAGFLTSVRSMYIYVADWTPKSIPRLKELLRDQLPIPALRTLEYCFLRAAGAEEMSTIENLLKSPAHPDSVADAYEALARLDHPAPIEKLIAGCADAGLGSRIQYLTTVLYHYSDADAYRFLNSYSRQKRIGSLAEGWHDILSVVETSPDRFRSRASKIFEKVLVEAIPRTLSFSGPSADADLLTTLLCLWRLQTVSPEDLVERLSEPTPQGEKIRTRLSTMLVGNGNEPPETVALPEGWDVPDEWFAAVLAGAAEYPTPFVHKTIFVDRGGPRRLQQQSRMLALANIRPEPAREALAADLSKTLLLYRDTWRTREPLMISSICSLLASARNQTADDALARFLAPGPYGREFPAWEGLLVGALVDPARHQSLLKAAASHPLPSIWIRARELLALADGNVAAFRNPDLTKPELPEALELLVSQLESAATEADVFVVFSRQRTAQLTEMALGLSSSPGAVAVLHARVDRSESPHSTYLLLANQPAPLDRRRFDDFLRVENYQHMDPAIMIGQVLRDDRRSLSTLRALAVGPRTGRNAPPLLHRVIAMQAYGALLKAAPAESVTEILDVIDRDPSLYVRHAAAAAALKCVKPKDKALLVDFAAKRPKLPNGVANILKLAGKL